MVCDFLRVAIARECKGVRLEGKIERGFGHVGRGDGEVDIVPGGVGGGRALGPGYYQGKKGGKC